MSSEFLKILLIDDDDDYRQMVDLNLRRIFGSIEIVEANRARKALELLKAHPNFSLVICDYDMPAMNGGELYDRIKKDYPDLPFIVHSHHPLDRLIEFTGLKTGKLFNYLQKPFKASDFLELSGKAYSESVLIAHKENDKIPVKIYYFYRFNKTLVDVYLGLGTDKFVKIINADDSYTYSDIEKFIKKNQQYLYINNRDYRSFINGFGEGKFLIFEKDINADPLEVFKTTHSYIHHLVQEIGVSDSAIKATEHLVKYLFERPLKGKKNLLLLLEQAARSQNYLYDHSYLLAQICGAIVNAQDWYTEEAQKKLIIAALFHDITLNSPELAKIQTLDDPKLKLFSDQEIEEYKKHPAKASELVQDIREFPNDIDKIIIQHHESMSGGGFPRGITHPNISPLSAVFIMAHTLVELMYQYNFDQQSYQNILSNLSGHFNRGKFQDMYRAFFKAL